MKPTLALAAAVALLALLAGCGAPTVAEKKMVSMQFTGTLSDGTVFETSQGKEPVQFLVGSGTMIPVIEKEMMGMKAGEKKKIVVRAADAFGEYSSKAIHEVPREQLPADLKLEAGTLLTAQSPAGPITVKVIEVKGKMVTIDFNHPLAGKDLTFEVEVLTIRGATKDELAKLTPPKTEAAPQAGPPAPSK
jgi:peptidylprolyl isomerase